MFDYKIWAYAILVKSEKYILNENQRKNETQLIIPVEYVIKVSEKLIGL